MHGLVALFLEVIVLAIILFVVGLVVLHVLVVMLRAIVVLIVLMMIVRSMIIAIALVASMIVAIVTTSMLMVARFTATRGRNMSCFLFLWLLLVFGNLLENASRLVSCLTLLKEGNQSEWTDRHHLVQARKLVLVCVRLREEDVFTLLLRLGYIHCSTEVVALAEELYLPPHEFMHRHESKLLGRTKPANQIFANVGEPDDSLKVVPDTFIKVCLCTICIFGASLCNDAHPFGQAYVLKTLTH